MAGNERKFVCGVSRGGDSVNLSVVAVLSFLTFLTVACGSETPVPGAEAAPVSSITAIPINAAAVATAAIAPNGSQYVPPVIPTFAIQPLRTLPSFAPNEALRNNVSVIAEWVAPFGEGFWAIAPLTGADGRLAYVSSGVGIYLADIGSPEAVDVGDLVGTAPGYIRQLFASAGLLVAITGDRSDPDQGGPAAVFRSGADGQLTSLTTIDGAFTRGTLSEDVAFLVAGEQGLQLFDLSDPGKPQRISMIEAWVEGDKPWEDFVSEIIDVEVLGSTAYVAAGQAGFVVFDVSDPASPERIGHFQTPGFAERVAIDEDGAFVANNFSSPFTIWHLDISDPINPRALGKYEGPITSGGIETLDTEEGRAYFTTYVSGYIPTTWEFGVIDVSGPDQPFLVGRIAHRGNSGDFHFIDGIAYLPSSTGLFAIDAESVTGRSLTGRGSEIPASIVGRFVAGGKPTRLAVQDNLVFLFTSGGLHVIDVGASPDPVQLSVSPLNGQGPAVIETGRALFLASRDNNTMMEIYDVLSFSDPRNLTWAGQFERPFSYDSPEVALMCPERGYRGVCYAAEQVQIDGPLTLAVYGAGARTEDHSANLVVTGSEHLFGEDIRIHGDHLYVVAGPNLFVFDVSEPREPVLVAKKPMLVESDAAYNSPQMWLSGDRLYVLFKGLWAFDISQPGEPVEIGYYPTQAIEMAAQDDRIALVEDNGRVEIVQITTGS
jgi:hypothetical protein